jgi:hypothetical protein
VLAETDDDEGRRRGDGHELGQLADPVTAEDRLVDDHHRRRDALEEAGEVRQLGDRRDGLDVRLRLQERPERAPHAVVTRRQEEGNARAGEGCGLR